MACARHREGAGVKKHDDDDEEQLRAASTKSITMVCATKNESRATDCQYCNRFYEVLLRYFEVLLRIMGKIVLLLRLPILPATQPFNSVSGEVLLRINEVPKTSSS
jgi:hypothetical protein